MKDELSGLSFWWIVSHNTPCFAYFTNTSGNSAVLYKAASLMSNEWSQIAKNMQLWIFEELMSKTNQSWVPVCIFVDDRSVSYWDGKLVTLNTVKTRKWILSTVWAEFFKDLGFSFGRSSPWITNLLWWKGLSPSRGDFVPMVGLP